MPQASFKYIKIAEKIESEDSYLDGPRLELALVICFGVAGAILLVLGLIPLTYGFSARIDLIIFGLLLIFVAFVLVVEFGFIERDYGIYSGPY